MEHLYVVTGNEWGADIYSKKNFKISELDEANAYFDKVRSDDFACILMSVDDEGKETTIREETDEDC